MFILRAIEQNLAFAINISSPFGWASVPQGVEAFASRITVTPELEGSTPCILNSVTGTSPKGMSIIFQPISILSFVGMVPYHK